MTPMNTRGLAIDAWIAEWPDDPYEVCPCGCGEKARFVRKDDDKLAEHEARYIAQKEDAQ